MSTDLEKVAEVYQLLLLGFSRTEIVQRFLKKYSLDESFIDTLMKEAQELLTKNMKNWHEDMLSLCVSRYDDLYRNARAKDDIKSCIAINKEMSEIFHLKKESSGKSPSVTITFNQGEEKVL